MTNTTFKQATITSNEKGRHAELIAQTALLANGWQVSEPITPVAYDLTFRKPNSKRTYYAQVKTAFERNEPRYGGKYVIVRGHRSNGDVYTRNEVDYFIAVYNGEVYMFPNREVSEYWIRPEDISLKWTHLRRSLP